MTNWEREAGGFLQADLLRESTSKLAALIWEEYEELLQELESDLMGQASEYVATRRPFADRHLVSALASVLLAEPFAVTDSELIKEAGVASLCLDHFTHLVDDITDKHIGSQPLQVHLASLLLARGIGICCSLVPSPQVFIRRWETYLRQASEGERFLWRHRNAFKTHRDVDFVMVGRRGSLAKTSAAVYAGVTCGWELLDKIEPAIDQVATGIQLVDDYLDWEDDLASGIYTYPVCLACREAGSSDHGEVLEKLVAGSAGHTALATAERFLRDASGQLAGVGSDAAVEVLGQLQKAIRQARELMIHDPASRLASEPRCPGDTFERIRKVLEPRMQH